MFCSQCQTAVEVKDRFCKNCGEELTTPNIHNEFNVGDNSFNAGQHNVITGNRIIIGKGPDYRPTAYIERQKVIPLKLGQHPIKVAWLIWSGLVGTMGSIASIWAVGITHHFLWLFLIVLSFMALGVGSLLSRFRFVWMPVGNFESSKTGEVFLTRIGGGCPLCDGKLKVRLTNPQKDMVVRCTRNPDHSWRFDPTVLKDL